MPEIIYNDCMTGGEIMKNFGDRMVEKFGRFAEREGQLFVVGGAVRDDVMGFPVSDFDLCLVGDERDVQRIFGRVERIHRDAPVFSAFIDDEFTEVALARGERGNGNSEHAEFFLVDTIEEDLLRRDFTVNAMAIDVKTGIRVDPFGGFEDALRKSLHPVDCDKFAESPERVGRAAMMIARFDFSPSWPLINTCRRMIDDFRHVPSEQMWKQFFGKMLAKGFHFRKAFEFLKLAGVFGVFPIFGWMSVTEQDPIWHPEGDVLTHTLMAMEKAAKLGADHIVMMAVLGHDMGKIHTTSVKDGRIVSPGHADEQDDMDVFMRRVHFPVKDRGKVRALVSEHMQFQFPSVRSKARFLRRLSAADVTVGQWAKVVVADHSSRMRGDVMPEFVKDLLRFADEFEEKADAHSRPLVTGHDLFDIGLRGKEIGAALEEIHVAWMAGEIITADEALAMVDPNRCAV
jgi:tRNA nucleotidyltransferase (CCA-adding enzyme)